MTLGGHLYQSNSYFFGGKFVTASSNKVNHFAILKHSYLNILISFSKISCLLKVLGICAEDFWTRADFHYEVRWFKGHSTSKISLVNLYSEVKSRGLSPLEMNNKRRKRNINSIFMHIQYEIHHFGYELKI